MKRTNKRKKNLRGSQIPKQTTVPPMPKVMSPKPCHEGPIEIIPNLFIGSYPERKEMVFLGVDVLVPLDHVSGTIWDEGFNGRLIYYPIEDFGVLPTAIANRLVEEIVELLRQGVKVGMFCLGGHGRTGYIASLVLGRLIGLEDPIAYLRQGYCEKAVETNSQVKHIAEMLNKPELIEKYKCHNHFVMDDWERYLYYKYI